MAITSYYTDGTSTATPTEYLIICPFEGTFSSTSTCININILAFFTSVTDETTSYTAEKPIFI